MDNISKFDIRQDIMRIETVLGTGIFNIDSFPNPLLQSAFLELMICLNDLLQKCKDQNVPVDFTDDVDTSSKIHDITDLVAAIRNVVCHIPSRHHMINDIKFSFNIAIGEGSYRIGDVEIRGEFPDDIAFFYGVLRIYLNRHIIRAFHEAVQKLSPFISQ